MPMQAPTLDSADKIRDFRLTLSEARFARYLNAVGGNEQAAVNLYHWNTELSKALYPSLQMWEVALRNRLNSFLCWKFKPNWPFDQERALRQLTNNERRKVEEAIFRQRQLRSIKKVSVGAVVADLSIGFWVALLHSSYDVPFKWRFNLPRIFPREALVRPTASKMCDGLLILRNRVAHHEPIYDLPLEERRKELTVLLSAMCLTSSAYVDACCTFAAVFAARPWP